MDVYRIKLAMLVWSSGCRLIAGRRGRQVLRLPGLCLSFPRQRCRADDRGRPQRGLSLISALAMLVSRGLGLNGPVGA